jgi:hypothetical protein
MRVPRATDGLINARSRLQFFAAGLSSCGIFPAGMTGLLMLFQELFGGESRKLGAFWKTTIVPIHAGELVQMLGSCSAASKLSSPCISFRNMDNPSHQGTRALLRLV